MNKNPEKFAIEYLIRNGFKLEEDYNNFARQVVNIAIEALEKQIPKRPKAKRAYLYAEYFEEWLECPECGEAIPEYTSDNETECYCVGCGQKLSWD